MKTRLIGDIHGEFELYHKTATNAIDFGGCERTIQVGDFGVGFNGQYWHDRTDEFHLDGTHRFIRGNHDDPSRCQKMCGWIKDGLIENDVMFIGGAWSIDHDFRVQGVSWWPEEELSTQELYRMIEIYEQVKPRVMITHDCPQEVSTEMFIQSGLAMFKGATKTLPTRTGLAFNTMLSIHQPEEWYFGHWHNSKQYRHGQTMFQCIGIHDYVDVEL